MADGLLRRVLTDARTGLPSVRYFRLIREWEERQAARRGGHVRTIRLEITGGDERVRRSLPWRLCGEFRTSDLLASDGADHYYLLLTGRDAERVDVLIERVRELAASLTAAGGGGEPVAIGVSVEPERVSTARTACEAPDLSRLETPPKLPRYDAADSSDERPDDRKDEKG